MLFALTTVQRELSTKYFLLCFTEESLTGLKWQKKLFFGKLSKSKEIIQFLMDIFFLLLIFRSTHDLVAMDGWLYAVGGNDGSSSLNSIEKYNPRSNKWVAASCMFTRRSSVGVAVLELLNFPPPSSPTLSVSSTSLWQRVKTRLSSSGLPCVAKRRNCSVWAPDEECFVGHSGLPLPGGILQHSTAHEGKKGWKEKSHTLIHSRPPQLSPYKSQCLKVQNNVALPFCGHFVYDVYLNVYLIYVYDSFFKY